MGDLRFILGDQLSHDVAALRGLDPARDVVLMTEVADETTYVPHHKQKLAFILSAMRHFAAELRQNGVSVDYVTLDAAGNTGSFTGELERAVARHRPDRVVITEPGEYRVLELVDGWRERLDIPVMLRADDRFFCSSVEFSRWAAGRKSFRMENFYRLMRERTGLLMDQGEPAGGQWNFDRDNRKPLPKTLAPPRRLTFEPDAVTAEVLALVEARFPDHFGTLDGFGWAVTRADAVRALEAFVADCLPGFGDYQDAMKTGEPFLFHATLSPYLNAGLLEAREVCAAAETAFRSGHAPLNAVEGFIRQILGWREYVRGIYWHHMPDYAAANALQAERALPAFYWTGETAMNCLHQAIEDTRRHAYAHHINRLMVTGNFALLAGVRPAEIEEWYLSVYADAYDWVELPNVHGMAIFADGGLMGSKPYAAGGAYIDRMSDYCAGCRYSPKLKTGPDACPFNYLYWAFLIDQSDRLKGNIRLAMPYRTIEKMGRGALQGNQPRGKNLPRQPADRLRLSPPHSPTPITSGVCQARCWPPSMAIICPVTEGVSISPADRPADLAKRRPAAEQHGRALAREIRLVLADALLGRAGTERHDPPMRREVLGHGPGRPGEARLGQRIGEELRRGFEHPLVDDIDDEAAGPGPPGRHRRGQQAGGGEVDGQMRHEARRRERAGCVVLEHRGVVDEEADGAHGCFRGLNDAGQRVEIGEVADHDPRPGRPAPRWRPRGPSASAWERWQWIATGTPSAASISTMARPMRRAPPVTSAAGGVIDDPRSIMSRSLRQARPSTLWRATLV